MLLLAPFGRSAAINLATENIYLQNTKLGKPQTPVNFPDLCAKRPDNILYLIF